MMQELQPVNLVQSGGDRGVANVSFCAFTYDVYTKKHDLTNDKLLASAVSLYHKRLFRVPMNAAQTGVVFRDADGKLKLLSCDETPHTSFC